MAITINLKKAGTLGGYRSLKVGTHTYKFTGAKTDINKKDPRGKEEYVILDLENEGETYRVNLYVCSDNKSTAEIAMQTIGSISKAVGFKGENFRIPQDLHFLIGKSVDITTYESKGTGANSGKTYVNISLVEPPSNVAQEVSREEENEDEKDAGVETKSNPWG